MKFLKLALAATVAFTGPALAADQPKVDPTYGPYETPGILAKIPNGQTIHIKCMGSGSPTVVLTAGYGDWSATWHKVQPELARSTRVCAWDRPGFGFSSGATQPQTVLNTTADLEAALKAAKIRGPYVAVGHSLGGYETMLFKDRNPKAVVGMVLVDSSIPDQFGRMEKVAPAVKASLEGYLKEGAATLKRCLAGLNAGKLRPGLPDPDGCWAYPPDYPPDLTAALDKLDTNPLRFTATGSLATHFAEDTAGVVNAKRNYGDMPLIVLTATKQQKPPAGLPAPPESQTTAFQVEFSHAHDEMAALSTRGVNRRVADTTHYIQYDKPQALIDAVNEVVAAARSSRH